MITRLSRRGLLRVRHLAVSAVCAAVALCGVWVPGARSDPDQSAYARYTQGKFVYERNCILCHGLKGDGNGELAPTLSPRPRSFREGMFKFRSTPYGKLPTDDDLRHTIRTGLSGTAMGMFAHLPAEDIDCVIEYVKSFSRRWRKPENAGQPVKLAARPEWFADAAQKAVHAEKGKAIFAAVCASCHGAAADGTGAAAAALKDLWEQPAKPSDLRQPHLRCGDRPEDIYRVLATGLNGTPMLSFDETMTPEQRWDIIAWIFTQKLPDVPNLGGAPPRDAVPPTQK